MRSQILKFVDWLSNWIAVESESQGALLDAALASLYAALERQSLDPRIELEEFLRIGLLSEWASQKVRASIERLDELQQDYCKQVGEFPRPEELQELTRRNVKVALGRELEGLELPF